MKEKNETKNTEVRKVDNDLLDKIQAGYELSDDDLESVSGGCLTSSAPCPKCQRDCNRVGSGETQIGDVTVDTYNLFCCVHCRYVFEVSDD